GGGDGGGVGDDGGDGLRLWLPDGEGRRRVEESEVSGWLDRLTTSILDVAGKIPPEKYSGGGATVVAGDGRRRWTSRRSPKPVLLSLKHAQLPVLGSTRMYRDLSLPTSGPK
ncbi:hypothetical protein Tco_1011603, partial [Tanacetum coccineum]